MKVWFVENEVIRTWCLHTPRPSWVDMLNLNELTILAKLLVWSEVKGRRTFLWRKSSADWVHWALAEMFDIQRSSITFVKYCCLRHIARAFSAHVARYHFGLLSRAILLRVIASQFLFSTLIVGKKSPKIPIILARARTILPIYGLRLSVCS